MINMTDMISTFSIHSRKSRSKQKQTQGLLMKGVTARQNANLKIWLNEIMNRKEVDLKLGKLDIQKQKQFKSNPSQNELILPSVFRGVQESKIFPMICFQKRTCRELIREIRVQENIQSLPPDDRRNGIFCGVIRELFHEIELTDQNILICKNPITNVFYIYFSDCQVCPISKCCYTSVVIVLAQSFGGQIKCNNEQCPLRVLATFEIQEDLFWKKKISDLSTKISKFVVSGKCRTKSLKSSIQPKENVQTTRRKKLKNSSITDASECN